MDLLGAPFVTKRTLQLKCALIFQHFPTKSPATQMKPPTAAAYAAAPSLWNSLPAELRDIQSLTIFKRKVKTHLFRTG